MYIVAVFRKVQPIAPKMAPKCMISINFMDISYKPLRPNILLIFLHEQLLPTYRSTFRYKAPGDPNWLICLRLKVSIPCNAASSLLGIWCPPFSNFTLEEKVYWVRVEFQTSKTNTPPPPKKNALNTCTLRSKAPHTMPLSNTWYYFCPWPADCEIFRLSVVSID